MSETYKSGTAVWTSSGLIILRLRGLTGGEEIHYYVVRDGQTMSLLAPRVYSRDWWRALRWAVRTEAWNAWREATA